MKPSIVLVIFELFCLYKSSAGGRPYGGYLTVLPNQGKNSSKGSRTQTHMSVSQQEGVVVVVVVVGGGGGE